MRFDYSDIDILSVIPTGRENAISMREIAAVLGLDSTRLVRKLINEARTDGALICSGDNGYWFPANLEEVRDSYLRSRSMALSILASLKVQRLAVKALKEIPGITLAEWKEEYGKEETHK